MQSASILPTVIWSTASFIFTFKWCITCCSLSCLAYSFRSFSSQLKSCRFNSFHNKLLTCIELFSSFFPGFIKYFSFSALLLCLAYVIATNDPLERLIEDVRMIRLKLSEKCWDIFIAAIVDEKWKLHLLSVAEATTSGYHERLHI